MELTKKQIQFIENRLENEGVKFWDIRIEMLDHVVTDVEKRTGLGEKFEDAVQNSFEELGWKGSFKDLVIIRQKLIAKLNRNSIHKELKNFFTCFKTLLIYGFVLAICYFYGDEKLVGKIIISLFLILFCLVAIFGSMNYKKVFKSANLAVTITFLGFLLSLLNVGLFLPKLYFNVETFSANYISVLIAILFPLYFIGYKVFIENYIKTNKVYLKLMKL